MGMNTSDAKSQCRVYINGEWVDSQSGESFNVINPASEQVIATAPKGTREDVKKALEADHSSRA
jgi:acyl-CoA reductase-like NAD-dependent aldehyde dehydrogenase